ncbi:MAG: DUF721 domain-containing protein [Candidatus Omnitrophica bacterium]|jgi:hypothetical protein|nr:DUF721 domain-containing protein [Candidatus Omnitrophota bacterium]MDD4012767.1 DUF721 domain-containing protein [Candidatus Omnitrophota bacterium]
MKKEARHVRGILGGILSRLEKGASKTNAISEAWCAAADEETRDHARPVSMKNGVLVVLVRDSVWLYKMTLNKKRMLKEFNDHYKGRKKALEIRFRVGEVY